jgi:hypothetical protein
MGRVPDNGDSVMVDGFRLTAVDVRGRRIGRVRIEPTQARTEPSDGPAGEDQGPRVAAPSTAPATTPAPTGVRPAANGAPDRREPPDPDARAGPGPRGRTGEAPATGA